jgi:Family of unknown function (DUF5309)
MPTGTATTYDLTEGIYLDFESMIHVLSPFDVPFQGQFGADGRSVLSTDTCFEKKVEWHDEELLIPRSTVAVTTTGAATAIQVAPGDQLNFSVGDMILLKGEYLRVTGYGATDVINVTRTVAGVNATPTVGDVLVGVGTLLPEGGDPTAARAVDRTNRYNMTEIFGPYMVQVSGTENTIRKYGLEGTNEFDHQVANRIKEISVAFEQALINGTRLEDTTNKWRSMAGMLYYITTNVNSSTTTLTETALLDSMQAAFDQGGNPNIVASGSKNKRIISGFTSSGTLQVQRTDNQRGLMVDTFESDFGTVTCVLNRWFRVGDLIGFNRDQASICTLRPLGMEMLAKTGDSIKGQVLQEKSLRFRRESHAFKFTALT